VDASSPTRTRAKVWIQSTSRFHRNGHAPVTLPGTSCGWQGLPSPKAALARLCTAH